jgi:diguanylate cyclase (GGDEF)-like protein
VPDPAALGLATLGMTVACLAVAGAGRLAVRDRRRIQARLADVTAGLDAVRAERDELAARLAHLELHDPLTGLPNRRQFRDRLRLAARPDATAAPVTVLLLDLDGFTQVNDRHGLQVGDELLAAVAERLTGCLRDHDLVARIGADQFAVLLRCPLDRAREVADRVQEQLALPFSLPDCTLRVDASIGMVPAPDDRWEPDVLLQLAGAALDQARRTGRLPGLQT